MTKKLQPTLRFRGFTDAWEQRKLGDVVTIQGGGTPSSLNKKYWDGSINWFTPAEVIDKRYVEYSNKKITESGLQNSSAVLMPKGTILFTSRASIGNMTFLSHPSATNQGFQSLIANSYCCNAEFLYAYGFRIKRFALRNAAGSTFLEISKNELAKCPIKLPGLVEQSRIGEFFKTLDNLIAATERKKELLQKKKQAYLQLIFSQHLRFKGFTKSWEQRKLNDIAYKVTEKNNNFSIRETFTNSAELGIVSQLDFFDRNLSNAENIVNYYIVRAKDFVYNPRISAAAPVGPINCNNLEREGIISPLYTVFRTHCIDTNYLEWFFKSSDWHKFMRYYGDSGARSDRFSIKDSLFFEMPIPYPVIEEQRKIGEFFKTLDNLIAAIDKKINLLKRRKKAYLQLMFI